MPVPVLPEFGGCVWPVDPACLREDWEGLDPAVQDRSLALASSTLRRLTGYRVGGCPVTVRPCKKWCADGFVPYLGYGSTGFNPNMNRNGQWVNSCGCTTDCGCAPLCEIRLPAPIGRIDAVKVDGVILTATDYRVDNGDRLVWIGDGECPWPVCQDLALADTEVGTFSVTYLNSHPVDALGAYAAGILAMEFARACAGKKCRLPAGVTQISRQGVTMEIAPGSFPGGFTGIHEVDAFISLWNPQGLRQQSGVWWPGKDRPRIVTGGGS